MRLPRQARLFGLATVLVWGCTVYDNSLVPDGTQLTGESGKAGQFNNKAGAESSGAAGSGAGAGISGSAGKSGESGGGVGSTGTSGSGNLEAGAGGEEPSGGDAGTGGNGGGSGNGGAAGSGGVAGAGGSGGSGGSGGAVNMPKCADHPITMKTKWVATASSESKTGMVGDGLYNPATQMTDDDFARRWSTGKAQTGVEWIQIDFGATVNLTQVTLNLNTDPGDYPRKYEVRVAAKKVCDATFAVDPTTKRTCDSTIALNSSGDGAPGNIVVTWFKPQTGRYLNVQQTATNIANAPWWSIAEVLVTCTDQ